MKFIGSYRMSYFWGHSVIQIGYVGGFHLCRYCCRNSIMRKSRRFVRKFAILWKISQFEVFRWLCYTLALLLLSFIMFYTLNQTKNMKLSNDSTIEKPEIKVVYSPRCTDTDCKVTQNKQLFIILIIEQNTSKRELSIIHETWCRDINRKDILYIVSRLEQVDNVFMSQYLVVDTREDIISLIFQYLDQHSLLAKYAWYLVLKSISVYVRVDKLLIAVSMIDPGLMLEFGMASNNRLCSLEHGVLFSEAFIREITQCLSDKDDVMIESMLRKCLRRFDARCMTDSADELGMLFSTEISHMSNILAKKSKDIDDAILISTPGANDVFYLLESAFHQQKYLELQTEFGNVENELNSVEDRDSYPEQKLYKEIWLEISNSTLISSLTQANLQIEQSREINKIGENIYKQSKQKIGLSNYKFIELVDTFIQQTFEKRIYHFTGLVENKFPDYKFVQMYKEDIRNSKGYIHSITPLRGNETNVKIAVILLQDANVPPDFARKNSEILTELNIEHFTMQINSKQRKYEKKLLTGLLSDILIDHIIILITSPIELDKELIETTQLLTVEGHQAYTALCRGSTEDGVSVVSIHSSDLLGIRMEIWLDCNVRNILSCVINGIKTETRLVVLDTNDKLCE